MWQWDQVESATLSAHLENAPYNFIEFLERNKLRDRQFADWNNKSRPQEIDLVIHPRGAISNFIGRGNAVASCRCFARETATNGGEINSRALRLRSFGKILRTNRTGSGLPSTRMASPEP